MSNQLAIQQSNLPADIMDEADALLASTKSSERLLKFKKGQYFVMDDEVKLGTEFIAHAGQLTTGWIKFVGNKVVERKMGRAADRFASPERNELGDLDQSQWERDDRGEFKDPWTFQHLLPFENPESGEVYIFTSSSIGGQIATEQIVQAYAKRLKHTGSRALPIIRIAVGEMTSKKFGKVKRPHFEIVGWEDAPAASPVKPMRVVGGVKSFPDAEEPQFSDAEIEARRAEAMRHANEEEIIPF